MIQFFTQLVERFRVLFARNSLAKFVKSLFVFGGHSFGLQIRIEVNGRILARVGVTVCQGKHYKEGFGPSRRQLQSVVRRSERQHFRNGGCAMIWGLRRREPGVVGGFAAGMKSKFADDGEVK